MNIVAASLVAQRLERQITPIALGLYGLPLCFNLLFTQPGERPATLGYCLLGIGLTLFLRALPLCGLSYYGRKFLLKGAGTAFLGGLSWWMALYTSLATTASVATAIGIYLLAVVIYRMFRKRDTVLGMTVEGHGADFFDRFADHLKSSGGIMEQLPINNWPYRCKYKSARFLMKALDEGTIAFCQMTRRSVSRMKKFVGTFPDGVDAVRSGCSVHPGITESFLVAHDLLSGTRPAVKDAYILDNVLCFAFDGAEGGKDKYVTLVFGPHPRTDRAFLEIFQVCAEDVFKANMNWDIPERMPLPQFVGTHLDIHVVHDAPLDRFGERVLLDCTDGEDHRRVVASFRSGQIRFDESEYPTIYEQVAVNRYLDYWGSYSPAYRTATADSGIRQDYDSNMRMAPRKGYVLTCLDTFDRSGRMRIGEFASAYAAIQEAMERAEREAPKSEGEQPRIYQVFDHDGVLLFSSGHQPPFSADRHIFMERLVGSIPFWRATIRDDLQRLLMLMGFLFLASIPSVILLKQDNGYMLLFSFLVYAPLGVFLGCCKSISLKAITRWGKFASMMFIMYSSLICVALLVIMYALFAL